MKKNVFRLLSVALLLTITFLAEAQTVPQGFNYQVALRNKSNNPIAGKAVKLRVKITDNSGSTTLWQEDHSVTTTTLGLVNVAVGNGSKTGGTLTSFSGINWGGKPKMEVQVDTTGGTTFQILGTNDFWSVPFAILADSAVKGPKTKVKMGDVTDVSLTGLTSGQILKWNGSTWVPAADDKGLPSVYTGGTGISVNGSNVISNTGDTDSTNDLTTSSNAGGDATGLFSNLTVSKVQGNAVSSTTPSTGQVLKWSGSDWAPSTDNAGTAYSAGTGLSLTSGVFANTGDIDGTDDVLKNSNAGGDASGNFSAIIVTGLQGNGVDTTNPTTGQVLKWDGKNWAPGTDQGGSGSTYTAGKGISINGSNVITNTGDVDATDDLTSTSSSGGDVSGNFSKLSVDNIKGNPVSSAKPTKGYVLKWSGTDWAPAVDDTAKGGGGSGTGFSPWKATTGGITYGNYVGIGAATPTNKLHFLDTLTTKKPYGALFNMQGGNTTGYNYLGIFSNVNGSNGANRAIQGQSIGASKGTNTAIYGYASRSSLSNYGGYFIGRGALTGSITSQTFNTGVYGYSDSCEWVNRGVSGQASAANSLINQGVFGRADGKGKNNGAYETSNTGVYGYAESNDSNNTGVGGLTYGKSGKLNVGVDGEAQTANTNALNIGIYGYATGGATDYAGYFDGDVNVAGALSKSSGSFKIDDPRDPANKFLYHSFVESPDMMNVYNGNITTDANGNATVQLPSYFNTLNKDYRYQLTVMGTFAQAIVAEKVVGNSFKIKTDKPNVEVSWQVTGVRQDPWANAHRIEAEVEKNSVEKGKYISPELYNQPESKRMIQRRSHLEQVKVNPIETK